MADHLVECLSHLEAVFAEIHAASRLSSVPLPYSVSLVRKNKHLHKNR